MTSQRPPQSTHDRVRHDTRSAAHTLHGFIELLASGVLGPLTEEQQRTMGHLRTAATRMTELVETALDLAQEKQRLQRGECSYSLLSPLTHNVVSSLQREQPSLRVSLELLSAEQETATEVEPIAFAKVVRTLIELISESSAAPLLLRVSQTDLHTSLVICAHADSAAPEAGTHSLQAQSAASADLESMARDWKNRDYLRLKHCESLLARQGGRLLVTADLTRARLMLPLQPQRA